MTSIQRWFALVLTAGWISNAAGIDIPFGPDRPLADTECTSAFEPAFRRHFSNRRVACDSCDHISGFPSDSWNSAYRACYRSCGDRSSNEFNALISARKACHARIAIHEQGAAIHEASSLYEKANETYKMISSPGPFLEATMNMPGEIMNMLRARKNEPLRKQSLEAELFKYSVIQAKAGIDAAQRIRGRGRTISSIQKTSLDEIAVQYVSALNDLDTTFREIDRTLTSNASPRAPQSTGRAAAALQSADPTCAVLNDPSRSAGMRDQDEERWIQLISRCRR